MMWVCVSRRRLRHCRHTVHSQTPAAIHSSAAPRTSPQLGSALGRHLPSVVLFCSLVGNPCTTLVLQDLHSKPSECKFQPFLLFPRVRQANLLISQGTKCCFSYSKGQMSVKYHHSETYRFKIFVWKD